MGIIAKQTVQSNVFIYLGVLIGFLNSGIILPVYFSPEEKGLLDYMNSISMIFASIFCFGLPLVIIKLYPKYRQSKKQYAEFIKWVRILTVLGLLLGCGTFLAYFYLFSNNETELAYISYFPALICVLITFRVLFKVGDAWLRMNLKSVLGAFLENFVLKGMVLTLLCLSFAGIVFDQISVGYGLILCVPGLWLAIALAIRKKEDRTLVAEEQEFDLSEFKNVAVFGILGSVGGILVMLIDQIMVKEMIGVGASGIYALGFYLALMVGIPSRGLKRIAAAVISESWEKDDRKNIELVYSKSVINQSIIAIYLFLGIWFSIDYLITFLRPEYADVKYVFLFIGIAQLIDMATGVNFEVITSSAKYRFNTYFTLALVALVVGLNLVLIPEYELVGAAIASLLAMFIINLARYFFLWKVYGFQPFNLKIAVLLLVSAGVFAALWFLPEFKNAYVGILVNGLVLTSLFWGAVLSLKLSEDINDLLREGLKRLGLRK